jgi:hypothetical protein
MDQSKSKKWPVQSGAAAAGAESVQCAHAYSIISLFNDFTFNPQLRSYLDEEQAQALKTMVCLCVCGGGRLGLLVVMYVSHVLILIFLPLLHLLFVKIA